MNHEEHNCDDPRCEAHYADFSGVEMAPVETEVKPATPEAQELAAKALVELHGRSFSGRHPELGKMINCQVCNRRHRQAQKCEQRFKELWVEEDLETGEITIVYATVIQPEGRELPAQISAQHPTQNQVVGARAFKGKRKNPHPSKRNLQFIEQVRALLPDEYTKEELAAAQKKARRILVKKFGRRGFLPPLWQKQEPQVAQQS